MNIISDKNKIMQIIYSEARASLEAMCPSSINLEKYFQTNCSIQNLNDVLHLMLIYLQNEFQIEYSKEKIAIDEILFNYHSEMITLHYSEDKLFHIFSDKFTLDFPEFKKSQWQLYTKSIISTANFINSFRSLEEFNKFIFQYKNNKLELIQLLQSKIFGMNFTIACIILQELGYEEYAKINVHVKDIFTYFNLCDDFDYHVFNVLNEMSKVVKDSPYRISQLFLLVCSGNFYHDNIQVKRGKEQLIEQIMMRFYQEKIIEIIPTFQNIHPLQYITINYEKILQTTVIRKYNNNYKYTYGRITLDCNVTNKFLKDKESCKIIVLYDEEADCLIIKKIIL